MIQIYQGACGAGKTTKLLELCGNKGIFVVFCHQEKERIKQLSRGTKCFTFMELMKGKAHGVRGDFYFDNLDLCFREVFKKPYMFGIEGQEIPIMGSVASQSNGMFFIDSDTYQRRLSCVDMATAKDFYIVSPSVIESDFLMLCKHTGMRYPITYGELLSESYHLQGVKGFYLHEAHVFLRNLTKGQSLVAATVTP